MTLFNDDSHYTGNSTGSELDSLTLSFHNYCLIV